MEIYKIYQISFLDTIEYSCIIDNLKNMGSFSIVNTDYYISTLYDIDKIKNTFKNKIKLINEITIKNYKNISSMVCQDWCCKTFQKNSILNFELSHQEYLSEVNKKLDGLLELKKKGKLDEYLAKLSMKEGDKVDSKAKENSSNESVTKGGNKGNSESTNKINSNTTKKKSSEAEGSSK
jgi:hypothetical protein